MNKHIKTLKRLRKNNKVGFTLVEIMLVVAILSITSATAYSSFASKKNKSYYSRAVYELGVMNKAVRQYYIDKGTYPADVVRNVPPGIESYLGASDADNWPDAPWPGSVYDYDAYTVGATPTFQISIRFCAIGSVSSCKFPKETWANNFAIDSSLYLCLEGLCKSHPSQPSTYPGYCTNCTTQPSS
jgi:prepilin-type N-terminal cleavage/methylation domain-containing protein